MATLESYTTAAGDRRWMVRYRTPSNGSTKKRGFTTRRDAQAFAATVEVAKLKGEYVTPTAGRVTIGELGDRWINQRSHLSPSSKRTGEIAWRVHVRPRWGNTPVSAILPSEVKDWVAEMDRDLGPVSIERNFGTLAGILDAAVDDRRISSNPIRGKVKLPPRKKKPHVYLTHGQVWALAEAADDKNADNRTLVLFLAYTGLRYGEAAGLRVGDYDRKRRRVAVVENATAVGSVVEVGTPKDRESRTVPIPMFLLAMLDEQCRGKDGAELLFPGPNGYLRPSHSTTGWFEYARVRAGLPRLTPHDLRHTAASLAVSAGANVKAVQRMLGHASAAMTLDVYADLFDDDLDAVAERLDAACAQFVPTGTVSGLSQVL
jgi:integrase